MNCKLLAIWISILLILWIILFYIQNSMRIHNIKESFISAKRKRRIKRRIKRRLEAAHDTEIQNLETTYNAQIQNLETEKERHKMDILNYQTDELEKNYTSIDELQGNIETTTRKLNILTMQTNELNKIAYIFKYITIISISLLILMICIFVLNFDHIKGPSARARGKIKSFFNKVKNKKIKI